MSSSGPREGQEAARDFQNQQIVVFDLDLNLPLLEESLDAAAQGSALGNENLQLQIGDAELDDVVIISPRKFEEAKSNSRRKNACQSYAVIQVFDEYRGNISEVTADAVCHSISDNRHENPQNQAVVDCELHLGVKDSRVAKVLSPREVLPEEPTFSCTICMGQLIEETSTKCGHIFCKKCIQAAIAAQHKCPTCRRKLRKSDMFRVYLPTAN
ncbi:E3 ubiquitin-protein ligase complex slx8-rfp subunit slx8 [Neltuma alba]|uniref:E3 ubiquitin-protein ligase complex slx8-rfp subunit slx8 n=1 Tax=Neltuma alba TaxID=207710 RepID=UPI0010A46EA1|nr:E3 ubiquitin-protein ligase complex slx8-rfp subunit slx8-like [Prosopis alba]XP_028759566.1 E3 ubiquitin-protein ligase complex slx8-rfp subunit slx8-like [Prosopis alba]XP_028790588.1 E3 ubiquitin-protein ligase complex slx8-rfp subunit slx8-like [Prosopis alba]XP_028790589.1 E3 ubiquitin-protein ligase complex slx8-rfp subunit slx8-like [Prosopis alba]